LFVPSFLVSLSFFFLTLFLPFLGCELLQESPFFFRFRLFPPFFFLQHEAEELPFCPVFFSSSLKGGCHPPKKYHFYPVKPPPPPKMAPFQRKESPFPRPLPHFICFFQVGKGPFVPREEKGVPSQLFLPSSNEDFGDVWWAPGDRDHSKKISPPFLTT